jgi:hypothetical protein
MHLVICGSGHFSGIANGPTGRAVVVLTGCVWLKPDACLARAAGSFWPPPLPSKHLIPCWLVVCGRHDTRRENLPHHRPSGRLRLLNVGGWEGGCRLAAERLIET